MEKMLFNDISGAEVGQCVYTTMLNEEGKIIDDLIIFRVEENKYWLSTLYIDQMQSWFNEHSDSFDVEYEAITEVTTMYAVQGPNSRDILNIIVDENRDDEKFIRLVGRKMYKV